MRTIVNTFATIASFTGFVLSAAATPLPAPTPTLDPHPQGTEVAFVTGVQKDLMARFPTSADAIRAGYFRYNNEDRSGSISYANLQWRSTDPRHPSQLWYDVNGRLLGADFSVLRSASPMAPHLWGVNPQRWRVFPAHIHYILSTPSGTIYGRYVMAPTFAAAGGNVADPRAATLVALGKASSVSQVSRIFLYPSIWDLIVWVKPNPNGAFADLNPNVKPSANAGKPIVTIYGSCLPCEHR